MRSIAAGRDAGPLGRHRRARREVASRAGYRDHLLVADARSAWDTAADSWGSAPGSTNVITDRIVELAAPAPGERVLELACGTGEAGIATALAAGAEVELVLSDFAPDMVAAARAAAEAAGLARIRGRELDLESIDEPDGYFDLVLCRMGIMLVADPARAAGEITRVLRPGGRAVIAVWGPRERNPWLRIVFEALGELWGIDLPPAEGPSPFALDSPDRLEGLLEQAGIADPAIEEVAAPLEVASPDEWWATVATSGGPLGQLVGSLPTDQHETVRARAIEAIVPEFDGRAIPRTALIAVGRRPGR